VVQQRDFGRIAGNRTVEALLIDTTTPLVEICRGGWGDVAVARTLGRLGVPVYLVAQAGVPTPVWSSRYWADRAWWDFARSEEDSLSYLLELGERLEAKHGTRPLLLTTADSVAIFIERNRQALQELFVFPQPVDEVIHSLVNKWGMHVLAKEHGIPTPITERPTSRSDVEEFVEAHGFPLVMKPEDPLVGPRRSPRVIHSRGQLLAALEDEEAAAGSLSVVLQEYVPGGVDSVWMCNGYFARHSEDTVTFTGKKLRQTSPTGVASLAICLPNETVATQTRNLMDGVGFKGCVGIGWRYDSRDGLYKLLDVNARVSGIFRLFAGTNNMDVIRACYLDLTGQHVPFTALQPGRKWMLEDDIVASIRAIRRGDLLVGDWLRSIRGVRELQWFARDDPAPGFVWFGDGTRFHLRAGLTRIKQTARGVREESPA
jgi:predicted ATP-grasp superfamily ATP-dependent carboligase